jgi:hypothetical protein
MPFKLHTSAVLRLRAASACLLSVIKALTLHPTLLCTVYNAKQVLVVTRHGARTPASLKPCWYHYKDDVEWDCTGAEQLMAPALTSSTSSSSSSSSSTSTSETSDSSSSSNSSSSSSSAVALPLLFKKVNYSILHI